MVECGPRSNPDLGCKNEQSDSEAAYAQALLWYISGNKAYAENATRITKQIPMEQKQCGVSTAK